MKRMVWGTVLLLCVVCSWNSPVSATPYEHEASTASSMTFVRDCTGYVQQVTVLMRGQKETCFMNGEPSFGVVLDGGPYRLVRWHPFLNVYLPVLGVCQVGLACLYHAERDMLIEGYPHAQHQRLKVHTRFREKLQLNQVHAYTVHDENPGELLDIADTSPLIVGAIALSRNGQWLVAELPNRGLLRVALETRDMTWIDPDGYQYDRGMNPQHHLAISDDGRLVVATGFNAGFRVYEVYGCGISLQTSLIDVTYDREVRCRPSDADIGSLSGGFRFGFAPIIFDAAGRFGVFRVTASHSVVYSHFQKLGVSEEGLAYIALGDSFTSGEGASDTSTYMRATFADESCHRSTRSYPYEVKKLIRFGDVLNIACSGGRMRDIVSALPYEGQADRIRAMDDAQKATIRVISLQQRGGGVLLQRDFVRRYQPAYWSVSVGGNDIGMIAKLKACAGPGTCDWATPAMQSVFRAEVEALRPQLIQVLRDVQHSAPGSRGSVIGYPDPIAPTGRCDSVTALLFDEAERTLLRNGVLYLNALLKSVADEVGLYFYDVFDATVGYRLCDDGAPAFQTVLLGDGRILQQPPFVRLINPGSFHPNERSHSLVAASLQEQEFPGRSLIAGTSTQQPIDTPAQRFRYAPEIFSMDEDGLRISWPDDLPVSDTPAMLATRNLTTGGSWQQQIVAQADRAVRAVEYQVLLEKGVHEVRLTLEAEPGTPVTLYAVVEDRIEPPFSQLPVDEAQDVRSTATRQSADNPNAEPTRFGVTPAASGEVLAARSPTTSHQELGTVWHADDAQYPFLFPVSLAVFAALGIMTIWYLYVKRSKH